MSSTTGADGRPRSASFRVPWDAMLRFAEGSLDRNPIHVDKAYAAQTRFAEPVVAGVHASLRVLSELAAGDALALSRLELDFAMPVRPETAYRIAWEPSADGARATVQRGRAVKLGLSATIAARLPPERAAPAPGNAFAARTEPVSLPLESLEGIQREGRYRPDPEQVLASLTPTGAASLPLVPAQLSALLWCSHFIGTEVPGRQALTRRIVLEFAPAAPETTGLVYRASVKRVQRRFRLLTLEAQLESDSGEPVARVEAEVMVRPEAVPVAAAPVGASTGPSWEGRTALVVGTTPLAAAVALACARRGAEVLPEPAGSGWAPQAPLALVFFEDFAAVPPMLWSELDAADLSRFVAAPLERWLSLQRLTAPHLAASGGASVFALESAPALGPDRFAEAVGTAAIEAALGGLSREERRIRFVVARHKPVQGDPRSSGSPLASFADPHRAAESLLRTLDAPRERGLLTLELDG